MVLFSLVVTLRLLSELSATAVPPVGTAEPRNAVSCPPNSSLLLPNGKTYIAANDTRTYRGAQEECRRRGGIVAIPRDEEEQRNLVLLKNCVSSGEQFWLGIIKTAGVWTDDRGTALGSFTSWAPGEPDDNGYSCAHIVFGDREGERRDNWADAHCSSQFRYVCEIEDGCSSPLGMESGDIEDRQLLASSSWNSEWSPKEARLNNYRAWAPDTNSRSEWLQIDLAERKVITGIQTQGLRSYAVPYFVTSFKLSYSDDGTNWNIFQEKKSDKIFIGNSDGNDVRTNDIDPPIRARFIRLMAEIWRTGIVFRLELLGCKLQATTTTTTLPTTNVVTTDASTTFKTNNNQTTRSTPLIATKKWREDGRCGQGYPAEDGSPAECNPGDQPYYNASTFCEGEMVETDAGQVFFPRTDRGTFSYSTKRCPSSSENERPLAARFCLITSGGTAAWDPPVTITCGISLQNLSQTTEVTGKTALTVATYLQVITTKAESLSIDDIFMTSKLMQDIINASATERIGESILTIADNLMKVHRTVLQQSQQENKGPTRVVQALETFADTVELTTEIVTLVRPDVALQTANINLQELDKGQGLAFFLEGNYSFSLNEDELYNFTKGNGGESILQTADISIILPANLSSALPINTTTDVRLSFILYNNDSLFIQPSQDAVVTHVISSRIAGQQVKNLPEPVVITFAPPEDISAKKVNVVRCVFWDFEAKAGQGAWSSDGCVNQGENSGRYTCTCNHLTNFAAFFDVHGSGFGDHEIPLEYITFVGCAVSIIALVLTLSSFIITRKQKQRAVSVHARNQRLVLINLCVALLAILIIFTAGIDKTNSPIGCTAVAALLHYFLLVALIWMAVEAVNIFLAAVMVFGHYVSESFIYKAAATAWGIPCIAMLSTVGPSSLYEYQKSNYCWLAHHPLTYAFLIPAGLILTFNTVVFSIVIYKLAKRKKVQKNLTGTREDNENHQWIVLQVRRAFSIMALFGLTWLFGFFVINGGQPVFAYLFCVFNSLQGFFIFIFHCILREDIRKWSKEFFCKRKKEKGKKQKMNTPVLDESNPIPNENQAMELIQFNSSQSSYTPDRSFEKLI